MGILIRTLAPLGAGLGSHPASGPASPTAPALLAVCLIAWLGPFLRSSAAQNDPSESQVQAVFLLNFTKFIEWPETAMGDPGAPMTICVLREDPVARVLDRILDGELVRNRRLAVRRISDVPRRNTCQVLFVGSAERNVLQLLRSVGPGVLTVSARPDFLAEGGMIQFGVENRRVRFDVRGSAASAAGLKLSSQLLKVARSVR